MAAPTPTTRVLPPGQPMKDGYRSLVTLAVNSSILLWENNAQPPGIDGGDPIRTSNMFTGTFHVDRPRSLSTLLPINMQCNYAALVYPQIILVVNVETTVTFAFPSGNYIAFHGYLRSFIPQAHVEGDDPVAAVVIQPTNWDSVNNVQSQPVTGTGAVFSG